MPTAKDARLQYEASQQAAVMTLLADSGDHMLFTSAAALWSGRAGFAPVVRPNGLLTGGLITPHASASTVAVAALTCNLAGVVTSVAAGSVAAARPATAVAKVVSITVNAAGALAAVAGTDGGTTAFSETRGAAGGPPLIPVDSIEIGQVRYTSNTAAVVLASEINQLPGVHLERADYPLYEVNHGPVVDGGIVQKAGGSVGFSEALPLIHTGPVAKRVYASYAVPQFVDVPLASDFVPPETTHSVSSEQVYGSTIGSSSSSLGQGSFTARLTNGVDDPLVKQKNQNLWFKFFPDRYATQNMLCQGLLGIARTFPAANQIQAACTISAAKSAIELAA